MRVGRRDRPTWSSADELLEEWARVSAHASRPRVPAERSHSRALFAVAAAVASVALVAVAAVTIIGSRPVDVAAPPTASPRPTESPSQHLGVPAAATWRMDPAYEVGPDSTSIHVLLTERECASGETPEGRVAEPEIEYTGGAVRILLRVHEIGGDCQSNPDFPVTVDLREPLGDRVLLDAGETPAMVRWTPAVAVECTSLQTGARVFRVADSTGLVSACEAFPGDTSTGMPSVEVTNMVGDRRTLELRWSDNACGNRTITFAAARDGGYNMLVQAEPFEGECPAADVLYGARLRLTTDVPADRVAARYHWLPTPVRGPEAGTPVETVRAALLYMGLKDLEAASRQVCTAQRDSGALPFAIDGLYEPVQALPGGDDARTLSVMELDVRGVEAVEVSRSPASATVALRGTIVQHFDPAAVEALFRAYADESGQPLDEALLRETLRNVSEGDVSLPVDQTVRVIAEDGAWRVCDSGEVEPVGPGGFELTTDPVRAPTDLAISYLTSQGEVAWFGDDVPAGATTFTSWTSLPGTLGVIINGRTCEGDLEVREGLRTRVVATIETGGECRLTTIGYEPYDAVPSASSDWSPSTTECLSIHVSRPPLFPTVDTPA